jgi:hypothetical protein
MNHTTLAVVTVLIAAGILGTISIQLAPQPVHAQVGGCAAAGAGSGGAAAGSTNSGSGQTCGTGGGATEGACFVTSTIVACRGQ